MHKRLLIDTAARLLSFSIVLYEDGEHYSMKSTIWVKISGRLFMLSILIAVFLSGCGIKSESSISKESSDTKDSVSSSSSENAPDSSSIEAQVHIDKNNSLTCGEFVWLWMNALDGKPHYNTIAQAMDTAQKEGYIPSDTNSAKELTIQETARLLTSTKRGDTKITASHYDWQISDLDSTDNAYKTPLLKAYAQGIITTSNGNIGAKNSLDYDTAEAMIARLAGHTKRHLPPDCSAPYFEYQGLVEVNRLDPSIIIDLKYATKNNFTGVVHYKRSLCLLEAATAKKLVKASSSFHVQGRNIKIWDGYRPVSVQWSLYNAAPANLKQYAPAPSKNSQHAKGIAADITLVDKNGNEIDMPTKFDDFSERAHAHYSNLSKKVIENRNGLIKGMEQQGFVVNDLEWWHFYLPEKTNLQISKVTFDDFIEKRNAAYQAAVKKYISNQK